MATQISIINRALRRIGAGRIESIDDDDDSARAAKDIWGDVREDLLCRFPWHFAQKTSAPLAELSTTDPRWGYSFALPTDCLKPLRIVANGADTDDEGNIDYGTIPPNFPDPPFAVTGATLSCDLEAPVLLYTYDLADPTKFSPEFATAFSLGMAVELGYSISAQSGRMRDLNSEFLSRLQTAMAGSGNSQKLDDRAVGQSFLNARRSGTP